MPKNRADNDFQPHYQSKEKSTYLVSIISNGIGSPNLGRSTPMSNMPNTTQPTRQNTYLIPITNPTRHNTYLAPTTYLTSGDPEV